MSRLGRFKPLGWAVAWLAVAWWAFWLNLDGGTLARFAQAKLNPRIAPLRLQLEGTRTEWFGLEVARLELIGSDGTLWGEAGNVRLSWAPWHLLRGQLALSAQAYQGGLEARLKLYSGRLDLWGEGLQPNRNLALRQRGWIDSNPTARLSGQWALWGARTGRLELDLLELTLNGDSDRTHLVLDLPPTRIERAHLEARLEGEALEIKAQTQGDWSAEVQGKVQLDMAQPDRSRLNLRLNAQLAEGYSARLDGLVKSLLSAYQNAQGRISVELSGPARAPQIKRI